MAEIIVEGEVPSITLTKEFLISLFESVNSRNPKNIPIDTEIIIETEKETRTFRNLRDFTSAKYIPRGIKRIELSKEAVNERDEPKIVAFNFIIDAHYPAESYYELIGFDEGKIETLKKEIDSLIDRNRTWYWFLFKGINKEEHDSKGLFVGLFFALVFSLTFLIYRILNFIRGIETAEGNQTIAVICFFALLWGVNKGLDHFLPYLDLRLRTNERAKFWDLVIGTLMLGLLGNLIWEGLTRIF